MGRSDVEVRVATFEDVEREPRAAVHLAVGMPANERMDWLVEKASELGAAAIQPLVTARAVVRLAGERAQRKREHWQAIAASACEQCGRNRVPNVHEPLAYADWLERVAGTEAHKVVLSLSPKATSLFDGRPAEARPWVCLSGPEGGLDPREEQMALEAGFAPVSLGPRVLRAETAPIALLSAITLA
jgi:16S rRNA (uracil1498-N3)-methyltransferase